MFLLTLFLAYSNGANDNFKGVATLYGSKTTTFRTALWFGTLATVAGCMCSVFLAGALVKAFSGRGLVAAAVAASPHFRVAVASGAASTVILATIFGFPISTTHSLMGALVGAGLVAAGPSLNLSVLGTVFFLPLLLSPVVSVLLTLPVYKLAQGFVERIGVRRESCICLGPGQFVRPDSPSFDSTKGEVAMPLMRSNFVTAVGTVPVCVQKYDGRIFGLTAQNLVNGVHALSAAAVSFARGLNDTPKIVAIMLVANARDMSVNMLGVAAAMAIGGLINSRKVAETMSLKISHMSDGQGLTANVVTALVVIFASRLGLPVSTTHVSVGAISGIGIANGSANRGMIGSILLSWVLTLPIAAAIAAIVALFLRRMTP